MPTVTPQMKSKARPPAAAGSSTAGATAGPPESGHPAAASSDRILRFQRPEVLLHWAIALPFMVCYLSSFILLALYTQAPERPYRDVFGWTHRISGLCLFFLPATVILAHPGAWKLLLYNIKQGWAWSVRDVRWLLLTGLSLINKRIELPEQGKFNAGEKMNFMMVMTTCPLFILTGVLIWVPGIAFFSWLAHFFMAIVATPLMFGHIFMATVNPSTRVGITGMISGYVQRAWAKHHYPLWYAEHFEEDGTPKAGAPSGVVPSPSPQGAASTVAQAGKVAKAVETASAVASRDHFTPPRQPTPPRAGAATTKLATPSPRGRVPRPMETRDGAPE